MTKEQAIQTLINVANAEVGYLEKASNSQLDSKTANAGRNNYTKYWRDLKPDWNGQAWCAVYVSWVFTAAFGIEAAKKMLKHENDFPYVYCPTLGARFTKYANPQVGDVVIFYRNGTFAHTGIVTKVVGDKFYTNEGNTSGGSTIIANGGGVCNKSYYNSNLPGTKFCRPDWSIVSDATPAPAPAPSGKTWLEYGDRGDKVKGLQIDLNKLGYRDSKGRKLEEDGIYGTNTVYAVKAFQRAHNLAVDGEAGVNTFAMLESVLKANSGSSGGSGVDMSDYIAQAQGHLNNFVGAGLAITGVLDEKTKKGLRKGIQNALNLDYGYGLAVDGIIGTASKNALRRSVVRRGSRGQLVTALEIGLLIHGIDPRGVESPGIFGSGLYDATGIFQNRAGITVDHEAGYNTFMALQK